MIVMNDVENLRQNLMSIPINSQGSSKNIYAKDLE